MIQKFRNLEKFTRFFDEHDIRVSEEIMERIKDELGPIGDGTTGYFGDITFNCPDGIYIFSTEQKSFPASLSFANISGYHPHSKKSFLCPSRKSVSYQLICLPPGKETKPDTRSGFAQEIAYNVGDSRILHIDNRGKGRQRDLDPGCVMDVNSMTHLDDWNNYVWKNPSDSGSDNASFAFLGSYKVFNPVS